VSQLVTAEDSEDRGAVVQAVPQKACTEWYVNGEKIGPEREIVVYSGERGRADREDEQQDVQPDPVLELRTRLPR
jgi:hypothetical protein